MLVRNYQIVRWVMDRYPFACGQGRLIDKSPLRRMKFPEEKLAVSCTGGFSLKVMPNDFIGRHIALTGHFDRTVVSVLLSFCHKGDERILDIGANVGYVSCALLHALPSCRVTAVEPLPKCFALLQENMRSVGGERGRAINSAVSDVTGTGFLVVRSDNTGGSHLAAEKDKNAAMSEKQGLEVPLIDGRELMAQSGLDRIDVIKIDVEGHEESVLKALGPILSQYRPRCVVFEHWGNLSDPQTSIRKLFDSMGYTVRGIRKSLLGWKLKDLSALANESIQDYVATPSP